MPAATIRCPEMKMDIQRLILLFIFSFSLLMLWEAWDKQGRPKPVPPTPAAQQQGVPAPEAGRRARSRTQAGSERRSGYRGLGEGRNGAHYHRPDGGRARYAGRHAEARRAPSAQGFEGSEQALRAAGCGAPVRGAERARGGSRSQPP